MFAKSLHGVTADVECQNNRVIDDISHLRITTFGQNTIEIPFENSFDQNKLISLLGVYVLSSAVGELAEIEPGQGGSRAIDSRALCFGLSPCMLLGYSCSGRTDRATLLQICLELFEVSAGSVAVAAAAGL